MLHVTCDCCGKELRNGEEHHVVKIEVFATRDPSELTEDDLDEDHMEAVAELLCQLEQADDSMEPEPVKRQLRFDLCGSCRQRYLRDPLGRESAQKLHFSPN
jgi:hypothetical protein